ncbi:MAG: class I adenylate-forming enzyme family protein [Dongiaceae bacterium]
MLNVATYLDSTTRRLPDAVAVRHRGRSYTYRQIQAMADSMAIGLMTNGIGRGSRVALCSTVRPGFIAAFFGILKTGATLVGFDDAWNHHDFERLIEDCEVDAIICSADRGDSQLAETLAAAVVATGRPVPIWTLPITPGADMPGTGFASVSEWHAMPNSDVVAASVAPDEVATIAFTSGTTGVRKGAQITHGNLYEMTLLTMPLAAREACARRLAPGKYEGIMAQFFLLLAPIFMGDTIVLCDTRDPDETLRIIAEENITYLLEMPIFYHDLIANAAKADTATIRRNLKICVTGGAAFPPAWYEEFVKLFGTPILPGYGATETTTAVTWCLERDGYVRGKVGRPIPGVKVRILAEDGSVRPAESEGEIAVSSPGVMKGYYGMPKDTARVLQNGWYLTGDRGLVDADGHLVVIGRLDDKITSGYHRIDPTAVENALCAHPEVSLAAVIGIPDEVLGQRAKAFIVLNPGSAADSDALRDWLADQVPAWMIPDLIEFRSTLPLTATGKVARAALRGG